APVLPEMASLEWAVHAALTSAEEPPLSASLLAEFGPNASLRFLLQPSLHFAVFRWPLLALWQGTHPRDRPLTRGISRTAIVRRGDRIRFIELSSARFGFWRSIARGMQLEHAAARALARDPMFDLVNELMVLFRAGLVVGADECHAH
ncbi:MAG: DUF2063 domain-containing protein, partial [Aestuariivirgaceae bacterium]